jgi:hypothetical protein
MKLVLNGDYEQMKVAASAFGFVGPVFYYGLIPGYSGFYICIFADGGKNVITGSFTEKPVGFDTDFPNALNVRFDQLTM